MPTYFKPGERARFVYIRLHESDLLNRERITDSYWSKEYSGQECTIVEQTRPPSWVRQDLLTYKFKFDDGFLAHAPHYCLRKLLKGDSYKRATKSLEDILRDARTPAKQRERV